MTQITKEAMTVADWLRASMAWLDDKSMRSTVLEKMEEAAEILSTLPIAGEGKVPEGWQLVPTVATLEMEHAAVARVKPFHDEDWYRIMPKDLFRLAWKALLAAAPVQISSPGKDGGPAVEALRNEIASLQYRLDEANGHLRRLEAGI